MEVRSHIGPRSGSILVNLSILCLLMVCVGCGLFICAKYLSIVTAPQILACAVVARVGGSFCMVLAAAFMLWLSASSLS